jgi:hypothetical protein
VAPGRWLAVPKSVVLDAFRKTYELMGQQSERQEPGVQVTASPALLG